MANQKAHTNGNDSNGNGVAEHAKRAIPRVNKKLKKAGIKSQILVEEDVDVLERPEIVNHKELLHVLTEVKNGNFNVRMPIDQIGLNGKICDVLNDIISMNEKMMLEFTKAGNTIGKQGKLTQRIELDEAKGAWSTGVASLNTLISDLVHPYDRDRTRDQ